jgi:hypothetical protein
VQRALLVMIASLLLAAGVDLWRSHGAKHGQAAAAAHDCCPHRDAPPAEKDEGDGGDACCDIGCYCTCAAGIVALSPARAPTLQPGFETVTPRVCTPAALFTHHDRGPPPTPPPIG